MHIRNTKIHVEDEINELVGNDEYKYPTMGSQSEIDSFNCQSINFNPTERPPEEMIQRALDRMETFYRYSMTQLRPDFSSKEHIKNVIEKIMKENGDKSPGRVFMAQGYGTNKDVLMKVGMPALVEIVDERINSLLDCSEEESKTNSDPVRIFIKNEPHSMKKVNQKRWRLIWGVSLVDQIIDRICYQELCEKSIENADKQAAKPGFSFKHGGVSKLMQKHDNGKSNWISFDASQFDFTVSGWLFDVVRQLNSRLITNDCNGKLKMTWELLTKSRELAATFGSFAFSDGTVCEKTIPGVQLSGRYTTIDSNSKIMILIRVLYDVARNKASDVNGIIAMGDDTVQSGLTENLEDFILFCKQICGITLTVESKPGTLVEQNFCSMDFKKLNGNTYCYIPRNFDKNMYALCNMDVKKVQYMGDTMLNLCIDYAFHDKFDLLHSILTTKFGDKYHSKQWFRNIITGYETYKFFNW